MSRQSGNTCVLPLKHRASHHLAIQQSLDDAPTHHCSSGGISIAHPYIVTAHISDQPPCPVLLELLLIAELLDDELMAAGMAK